MRVRERESGKREWERASDGRRERQSERDGEREGMKQRYVERERETMIDERQNIA